MYRSAVVATFLYSHIGTVILVSLNNVLFIMNNIETLLKCYIQNFTVHKNSATSVKNPIQWQCGNGECHPIDVL